MVKGSAPVTTATTTTTPAPTATIKGANVKVNEVEVKTTGAQGQQFRSGHIEPTQYSNIELKGGSQPVIVAQGGGVHIPKSAPGGIQIINGATTGGVNVNYVADQEVRVLSPNERQGIAYGVHTEVSDLEYHERPSFHINNAKSMLSKKNSRRNSVIREANGGARNEGTVVYVQGGTRHERVTSDIPESDEYRARRIEGEALHARISTVQVIGGVRGENIDDPDNAHQALAVARYKRDVGYDGTYQVDVKDVHLNYDENGPHGGNIHMYDSRDSRYVGPSIKSNERVDGPGINVLASQRFPVGSPEP